MTSSIKRDLIKMLNQAQMDNGVRIIVFIGKAIAARILEMRKAILGP